jgi:hypothetical protein
MPSSAESSFQASFGHAFVIALQQSDLLELQNKHFMLPLMWGYSR